jgi:hypothetical protein
MTQALVWADDRAEFLAETDERYQLAGADGTVLLTFNDTADEHGVMWVADEPEGWVAPEVDLPSDAKGDGHGSFTGEATYDERVLTVTGSAEAPTLLAARQARQRLVNALTSTVRDGGELLWTHLDDAPAKSLRVELRGQPKARQDGRWIDYSFVIVAGDPIKAGPEATYGPVRLLSSAAEPGRSYTGGADAATRGRSYPSGADAATRARSYTGGQIAQTVALVVNEGTEPAHVVYVINGPVPRPVIQLGHGEFAALDLDLGAADEAVVDTDAGTVEVNGVNRYEAFVAGSTFPMIPPGGTTEVRLLSTAGGTDPAAGLTITTAPRWT